MEPNAASVALIAHGQVLLIRRAFEPLKDLWTLPGGRREANETIEETAAREVKEELGLTVFGLREVMTMGVADRFRLRVFVTEVFAGEISASPEIGAWLWADPHELGNLPTTPRLGEVLERSMLIVDRS